MTKIQRLNALIIAAACSALPALAQFQITGRSAPRLQPPYTAEFKTTHVQTLANGTTITTETKEVVARDQQMRRITSITNAPTADRPAITNVRVNDPATGDEITWNSSTKVALDVRRPVGAARQGCWATPDGHYKANYGSGNANARPPMQPLQPLQPPPDAATPAGPIATAGPDPGNMTHEDLGADTIMGVQVRGSRTTVTTPAGAMGNDQPLVSVNEIWMAPSLGVVLRSASDDPRMGKTNREVVSVDLSNPDPSLFQPPAGYKLVNEQMQPVPCAQ